MEVVNERMWDIDSAVQKWIRAKVPVIGSTCVYTTLEGKTINELYG